MTVFSVKEFKEIFMAATKRAVLGRYLTPANGPLTIAGAFPQVGNDSDNLDLLQIIDEGGLVLVNVDYAGTVNNPASGATNGTRVGQFRTRLGSSATLAQLFADAFTNPGLQDIIHIGNVGSNVHYYIDYTGVASGS
jgi:hypothetical protein